jgi:hypothetical protein
MNLKPKLIPENMFSKILHDSRFEQGVAWSFLKPAIDTF